MDNDMKRIVITLILSALTGLFSIRAAAQFIPGGELHRSGNGMKTEDKVKLTEEEKLAVLMDLGGEESVMEWNRYARNRNLGMGLTIGGSVTAGAGAVMFVGTGLVYVIVMMFGAATSAVVVGGVTGDSEAAQESANNTAEDIGKQFAPWFVCEGVAVGVGALAAATGIPILVVNSKKMNAMVGEYNKSRGYATLGVGPTRSGVGLSLTF